MPIRPQAGTPNVTEAERLRMSQVTKAEGFIEFSAGNPGSLRLDRQVPITELECCFVGTFTATTAPTAVRDGILACISQLSLTIDGDQTLMRMPGWALELEHRIYEQWDNLKTDVAATDDDVDFVVHFSLPIDVGQYMTALDASRNNQLTLDVIWGQPSDVGTGSAGAAITGGKLYVRNVGVAGGTPGQRGGIGFPYWRHYINHRSVPITQNQTDLKIELNRGREYSNVVLVAESDGSYSDAVLNELQVKIGNVTLQPFKARDLKARQWKRYQLVSGELAGVYVVDFGKDRHLEHLLSVGGTQDLELIADVTKQGTACTLHVIEDYYRKPQ